MLPDHEVFKKNIRNPLRIRHLSVNQESREQAASKKAEAAANAAKAKEDAAEKNLEDPPIHAAVSILSFCRPFNVSKRAFRI